MNLPNKLTIFRMILVVPFVFTMLAGQCTGAARWLSIIIFIVASLTDLLDGKIARKYNLVTDFGKFMDPLADKILVCCAMICLVSLGRLQTWICLIIICREFIISGFRLVAADNGIVIAASYWGKFKTTFQMIMIILLMLDSQVRFLHLITVIVVYISCALTIISLVDYLVKNKEVLASKK
ncbi:MAG: CDP-diacylglycerol--glycerol-3-phosphate 3-phosphatidyltransferase [Lachnospiraceae bacterium]|nr:CDP-diacylglycerol--glycerol-3-phosphate 3-phosphatidyltransferase [Lachnospiraceae bacterium]